MMGELKEYLKEKEMEAEKSKIMRFRERVEKGRNGKRKWGKDGIEEIGEYKYWVLHSKDIKDWKLI